LERFRTIKAEVHHDSL